MPVSYNDVQNIHKIGCFCHFRTKNISHKSIETIQLSMEFTLYSNKVDEGVDIEANPMKHKVFYTHGTLCAQGTPKGNVS